MISRDRDHWGLCRPRQTLRPILLAILVLISFPQRSPSITWTEEVRLTSDPAPSYYAAIATDRESNVHVVWTERMDGSNTELHYLRHSGGQWAEIQRLTDAPQSSYMPAIATDQDNNVHVVWVDGRDYSTEIYYKRWDGDAWIPDKLLTWEWTVCAIEPSIAVDTSGHVHVVWTDWRHVDIDNFEIFHKWWDGVSWTEAERLTYDNPDSWWPQLCATPDGRVHLFWYSRGTGNEEIYRMTWDGNAWGVTERVTDNPDDSTYPAVAAASDGTIHVVWQEHRNLGLGVYYKRWDGDSWTPEEPLAKDPPSAGSPVITVGPDGVVHVVWVDDRLGYPDLDLYYRGWNGVAWTDEERLTEDPAEAGHASVATDPNGDVHLVWSDYRHGEGEIYYKRGLVNPAGLEDGSMRIRDVSVRCVPNPFRRDTTFRCRLPGQREALLQVYDVSGRRVRTFRIGEGSGGIGELVWDGKDETGRDTDAGIYFYHLEANGVAETGRAVLIR